MSRGLEIDRVYDSDSGESYEVVFHRVLSGNDRSYLQEKYPSYGYAGRMERSAFFNEEDMSMVLLEFPKHRTLFLYPGGGLINFNQTT